jgi:hypothetical protein
LKLKSSAEWRSYCKGQIRGKPKKPEDISTNPNRTYQNKGWVSWGHWLGTGAIADRFRVYQPFIKARSFVRGLDLENGAEWKVYCNGQTRGKPKKPDNIPAYPNQTYRDKGWVSMGDWLGTA